MILVGLFSAAALGANADGPVFHFPEVPHYGGIARTPKAAEPPRRGAKIVFDIVADGKVRGGRKFILAPFPDVAVHVV